LTGVGEKTPTPLGPPSTAVAALVAFVTAEDGALVPVENSPVVVADDVALVDELDPEVVVVETASCARNKCGMATRRISVDKKADNCFIARVMRFESRPERRNRFVKAIRSNAQAAVRYCSKGLFLNRAISSDALDRTIRVISILDPRQALRRTSILPP